MSVLAVSNVGWVKLFQRGVARMCAVAVGQTWPAQPKRATAPSWETPAYLRRQVSGDRVRHAGS